MYVKRPDVSDAFLVLWWVADCCGYVIVDKPVTPVTSLFNPNDLILTNYVPGQKDITGCYGKYCCV
jgi:hypothetical protein